ncbi:MAG: chorismate-binding protein, partial [Candidatus Marinimicrobia bacterium]|nr:chorismate-binding protein [Candidatus Neomarinimicrobiota bacterium]
EEIEKAVAATNISFLEEIKPDISDADFACEVSSIKHEEIAKGNACQVIFSRKFKGRLKDMSPRIPLALFRRLLDQQGQYLTFLFSDGDGHYFVGASPERQLEIHDEYVIKNPISGTMPKGDQASFIEHLDAFIEDQKEINELSQILDEELKIMAQICPRGGKISGPFLRESGAVIHTEYHLTGHSRKPAVTALRLSLHSPTLVGSPLESAFRIIKKRESSSRRYYGGEVGVIRKSGDMYSAIMIRTAEIFRDGRVAIQAGAGIVKDSHPQKEAQETVAKATGLINALKGTTGETEKFLTDALLSQVNDSLAKRNQTFSSFHFEDQLHHLIQQDTEGRRIAIINNEDNFSHILSHLTHHIGYETEVIDTFDYSITDDRSDLVILGPGPGDINDEKNPRMLKLMQLTNDLLESGRPVLGICLGLQAMSKAMNIPVTQQKEPTQGLQVEIDLFGSREKVGLYNSFSPLQENVNHGLKVSVDGNNRIMAMKKPGLYGLQFHPESAMTQNGYRIISTILNKLFEVKDEQR